MIRGLCTFVTLASVVFFPWQLTALLAVALALYVPLVPLAAGIFFDTLYYTSNGSPTLGAASGLPLAALCGAVVTVIAFVVRSKLDTGIIGK